MPKKIYTLSLDTELVEYHKKEADRQGRSFSNYINNLLNFPCYEKDIPSQRIIAAKTTTNNGVVRRRVKSD